MAVVAGVNAGFVNALAAHARKVAERRMSSDSGAVVKITHPRIPQSARLVTR